MDGLHFLLPVGSIGNYGQMRAKLAGIFFWEIYLATFLAREVKPFSAVLNYIESLAPVAKAVHEFPNLAAANPGGLIVAIILSLMTYMTVLHDRISDVFHIRRNFDLNNVIIPIAKSVNITFGSSQIANAAVGRDRVMREVFYKYASSRAEKPLVDKHDIEEALTNLSWLWAAIEGVFLWFVLELASVWWGSFDATIIFGVLALTYFGAAVYFHRRAERYMRPQIHTIVSDAEASAHVRQILRAL